MQGRLPSRGADTPPSTTTPSAHGSPRAHSRAARQPFKHPSMPSLTHALGTPLIVYITQPPAENPAPTPAINPHHDTAAVASMPPGQLNPPGAPTGRVKDLPQSRACSACVHRPPLHVPTPSYVHPAPSHSGGGRSTPPFPRHNRHKAKGVQGSHPHPDQPLDLERSGTPRPLDHLEWIIQITAARPRSRPSRSR
jgi:hypothetical protein